MSFEKILQLAKFLIGWPISILALFFIARVVIQNRDVLSRFENINPPLFALSAISFFFYFFFKAYLWQKIIEEKGFSAPFRKTVFLWEMAEVKRFAPGFIWPLVSKTLSFSKDGLEKKTVAYSLAIEAEVFLVGCFLASLICLPFISEHFPIDPSLKTLISIIIITGAAVSLTLFVFPRKFLEFIRGIKTPFDNLLLKHAENSLPTFSWITNLRLVGLSILALFFFGLGTYFSITSFSYLDHTLIFQFIGFFILSFLISYLSFLIPMGLGIREGIIIYGLSPFIPIAIASAAAILSRIILIISEFIFLSFSFLWSTTRNSTVLKIENFIAVHKPEILTAAAITIYIVYFTTASFLRYDTFYTGRFDLGNMDQAVWNTIHGRIFETSNPDGTAITSRLAGHADFILILISPLYKIWEDPRMLLLLQTTIVGLGAIFVFKIADMVLKSRNAALVFSLAYLLNPSLQYANLYDFHAVTLATTFLLATFYYFMKRQYLLFFIFAILAGLTKEQIWLVIGLFGIYTLFFEILKLLRRKSSLSSKFTRINLTFGTLVAGISFLIFYFLLFKAIPQARGGEDQHFALTYYSEFGDSLFSVMKNILTSPGKIIEILGTDNRIDYLVKVFLPLGYLSLLSPAVLIFAFPDFIINLLSNNSNLHQIYYQYTSGITPFIFIAAIFGVKNLTRLFPQKQTLSVLLIFISAFTIHSAYEFGPMPGAKHPNLDMFTKQLSDRKLIQSFIEDIPQEYKVTATNNLGSHLSRRRYIFTIPEGIKQADIVAFLLNDPFAQPSLDAQRKIASEIKTNKDYKVLIEKGDFVVFQKKN